MKRGKKVTEGIKLPNKEKSESLEKRKMTNAGNNGSEHHQIRGAERKKIKEYLRWTRKFFETKLCSGAILKIDKGRT